MIVDLPALDGYLISIKVDNVQDQLLQIDVDYIQVESVPGA